MRLLPLAEDVTKTMARRVSAINGWLQGDVYYEKFQAAGRMMMCGVADILVAARELRCSSPRSDLLQTFVNRRHSNICQCYQIISTDGWSPNLTNLLEPE